MPTMSAYDPFNPVDETPSLPHGFELPPLPKKLSAYQKSCTCEVHTKMKDDYAKAIKARRDAKKAMLSKKCSDCSCKVNELTQLNYLPVSKKFICHQCLTNNYATCDCGGLHCEARGQPVKKSSLNSVWRGKKVCNSCYRHQFVTPCYICQYRFDIGSPQNFKNLSNFYVCVDCCNDPAKVAHCPECFNCYIIGIWHDCPAERRREEQIAYRRVNEYSFKPIPSFVAVKSKKGEEIKRSRDVRNDVINTNVSSQIFLGVELEHTYGCLTDDEIVARCNETFGNFAYYKNDSSLHGEGIEFVTHPFTIGAIPFDKFREYLKWLQDNKCRSYNANVSCGLHVHVSRTPLIESDKLFELKLCIFILKHETELFKLSKRIFDNWDRYCRIPRCGIPTYSSVLGSYKRKGNFNTITRSGFSGHQVALNIRSETYEFRMMRGTLDFNSFVNSVKIWWYLCQFIKDTGIGVIINKPDTFKLFVNSLPPMLRQWTYSRAYK